MELKDFERLLTSFDVAVPAIDELIVNVNQVIEDNKALRAMIDTKAFLEYTNGDILKSLKQQNILSRSLMYLIETDDEIIEEVIQKAIKNKDKEVVMFWKKRVEDVK
ncbi:MAG: hypothetical protein WC945_08250 [Bacteroidales bacterium]